MISGRWNTGMAFPLSVIEGAFSVLIVERMSFHRCGRNCAVGMFPLVLEAEESSPADPVLAEDVQQLEDTLWRLLQAGGKRGCGEMELEDAFGGCM